MAILCIYGIVDHPSTKEKNHVSENYYVQIIVFLHILKKRDSICGSFFCLCHWCKFKVISLKCMKLPWHKINMEGDLGPCFLYRF